MNSMKLFCSKFYLFLILFCFSSYSSTILDAVDKLDTITSDSDFKNVMAKLDAISKIVDEKQNEMKNNKFEEVANALKFFYDLSMPDSVLDTSSLYSYKKDKLLEYVNSIDIRKYHSLMEALVKLEKYEKVQANTFKLQKENFLKSFKQFLKTGKDNLIIIDTGSIMTMELDDFNKKILELIDSLDEQNLSILSDVDFEIDSLLKVETLLEDQLERNFKNIKDVLNISKNLVNFKELDKINSKVTQGVKSQSLDSNIVSMVQLLDLKKEDINRTIEFLKFLQYSENEIIINTIADSSINGIATKVASFLKANDKFKLEQVKVGEISKILQEIKIDSIIVKDTMKHVSTINLNFSYKKIQELYQEAVRYKRLKSIVYRTSDVLKTLDSAVDSIADSTLINVVKCLNKKTFEYLSNQTINFELGLKIPKIKSTEPTINLELNLDIENNQSNIIDGTAKFIVKRVKKELALAFINSLKDSILTYKIANEFLPNTYDYFMNSFDDKSNKYLSLKENLQIDLLHMFENAIYSESFNEINTESVYITKIYLKVFSSLIKKKDLNEIILSLDIMNCDQNNQKSALNKIAALLIFTYKNFYDMDKNTWISPENLRERLNTETKITLFQNLIDFQLNKMGIDISKSFFNYCISYIDAVNKLSEEISSIKEKNGHDFVEDCFRALSDINEFLILNTYLLTNDDKVKIDNIKKISSSVTSILHNVTYKNLNQVIIETPIFLKELIGNQDENNKKFIEFLNGPFMLYTEFFIALLKSDNSDDIEKVIEYYALPSGSFKMKSNRRFTINLNSYPGFQSGWEIALLRDLDDMDDEKNGGVLGITCPIGVDFSFTGKWSTVSFYLPFLDIAAPFTFRLINNDSTETLPAEVTFMQLFSFGGYVIWHMDPSIPFSLGLGVQRLPKLRAFGNSEQQSDVWLTGLNLCIDIPLWNIHSSKRESEYKKRNSNKGITPENIKDILSQ